MKERGILFSAPMVRALLAGTKTQTRRVLKVQPKLESRELLSHPELAGHFAPHVFGHCLAQMARCPYGAVGDRLWVRETWQALHVFLDLETGYADDFDVPKQIPKDSRNGWWKVAYAATDPEADTHRDDRGFSWRPAIHMPRWASRITLEVTEIRAQRLHEITEEDARAEGVTFGEPQPAIVNGEPGEVCFFNARDAFAYLWAAINGADSWKANPFVWAITFKRVQP